MWAITRMLSYITSMYSIYSAKSNVQAKCVQSKAIIILNNTVELIEFVWKCFHFVFFGILTKL